jgi:hypothetical protein
VRAATGGCTGVDERHRQTDSHRSTRLDTCDRRTHAPTSHTGVTPSHTGVVRPRGARVQNPEHTPCMPSFFLCAQPVRLCSQNKQTAAATAAQHAHARRQPTASPDTRSNFCLDGQGSQRQPSQRHGGQGRQGGHRSASRCRPGRAQAPRWGWAHHPQPAII